MVEYLKDLDEHAKDFDHSYRPFLRTVGGLVGNNCDAISEVR